MAANSLPNLAGVGIGWRPELALFIHRSEQIRFVEILAESFESDDLPEEISQLRERNMPIIPHGISLSLGGADPPDRKRLDHLARLAEAVNAPLVSEHLAFVRAADVESGHLLPVARTADMLEIVIENILIAQRTLPVPLALENITSFVDWPENEWSEAEFHNRILETTGTLLLLDLENVHANAVNRNSDWESEARGFLRSINLQKLAYCHVAGGMHQKGRYHDTHASPVSAESLQLLGELRTAGLSPAVLLERDDHFPSHAELTEEIAVIKRELVGHLKHQESLSVASVA